jgi:hypothetical protein
MMEPAASPTSAAPADTGEASGGLDLFGGMTVAGGDEAPAGQDFFG